MPAHLCLTQFGAYRAAMSPPCPHLTMAVQCKESDMQTRGSWVLAAALLLVACGGDQGNASSTAGKQQPATPPAEGRITAVLDGEEQTWLVLSRDFGGQRHSQSDWSSMSRGGGWFGVSIFAHAQGQGFGRKQALMIGFSVTTVDGEHRVNDPELTYLATGSISNNYSSGHEGGSAEIALDSVEVNGEVLNISGSFSGTLRFKSLDGSQQAPGPDSISFSEGRFTAELRPPAS